MKIKVPLEVWEYIIHGEIMQTQPCDNMWLVKGCEVEWIHNQSQGVTAITDDCAKVTWTLSIYNDIIEDYEALLSVDYLENAVVPHVWNRNMYIKPTSDYIGSIMKKEKLFHFPLFV